MVLLIPVCLLCRGRLDLEVVQRDKRDWPLMVMRPQFRRIIDMARAAGNPAAVNFKVLRGDLVSMACFKSSCCRPAIEPRAADGHWYCGPHQPTTTVVHVNDPRFKDNPAAVYIGRKARRASDIRCRKDSPWANPYNVAEFGRT